MKMLKSFIEHFDSFTRKMTVKTVTESDIRCYCLESSSL